MKRVKIIARALYIISRILALGYSITTLYAAFCIVTGVWTSPYEEKFLHIFYPFTTRPFLIADNNVSYLIFSLLLPLGLYSVFFWWVSGVFKVFFQSRLFTAQNIVHLNRFCIFNLIAPVLATILSSFFVPIDGIIWELIVVHIILGTFTFFFTAIFRQGLDLQNEQDLFI